MRMSGAVESDDVYVTAGLKGVTAGESGGLKEAALTRIEHHYSAFTSHP